MKKYVVAIDQGTTSSRAILFNQEGEIVVSSQKEHEQIYPQPGWVEHDPVEIWQNTESTLQEVIRQSNPTEIATIGITNQRETTVVWNKETGKPYYNAIVWQDTRTAEICASLAEEGGYERFRPQTGLPLSTYFSGTKLVWLLENIEGLRAEAEAGNVLFGTMDTWVIWNLTGNHVTDVTNAGRTLLMDLETLDWSAEILDILNIPRAMLPQILPSNSATLYGETMILNRKIPISAALGDQHAAMVGQTCFHAGEAKNTYGTGCFMLMNTGETIVPSVNGLLTTLAYQFEGQPAIYALEGSVAIAGALVQWVRDNLEIIESSAEIEELAQTVDDNGGVYFVPAFSGLYAPYWRDDARGIIAGLTRYVNKGHLARAVLEATAYQTREVLTAMEKDSGVTLQTLKVDGGMIQNELLMQFQSDILGVDVVRPKVSETTALGAAYAAGLAVGFWESAEALRSQWQVAHQWTPQMDTEQANEYFRTWQKAVTRTFDWID